MRQIGAVDIGGTKIAAGIVREDGTLLHRVECPTNPELGFAQAIDRIQQMLADLADRCGVVSGIGIGCPGPLDPFTGIIGEVGTLPGWENGNLTEQISHRFDVSVAVENDADAAALAEYEWGTSTPSGTLIYITVSTGIGGGVVLGGQLYRGVGGSHPEFGHQIIDPSGPLCYCGITGCWESLASGPAMTSWFQQNAQQNESLSAEQICALARQGNSPAVQAVRRSSHYLGLGLANLVTMFAPQAIRLSGGLMRSSDLFLKDVQAQVLQICTQVPAKQTSVEVSQLGPDVGLLGAAQSWLLRNP